MNSIIFGGSGFIGSHLAADLVSRGDTVVISDLVKPKVLPAGVRYRYCDVRESIDIANDESFDVTYNLAAVHRTPGHEPHEYYETNVMGAWNVTEWSAARDIGTIVFTSSIAVYGPSEEPLSESSMLNPTTDYGRSKLMAERIHRTWVETNPLRKLVVARPAVVFGTGEQNNFTRLAKALSQNRFLYAGRTDVIKSCGYVGDLIKAIRFAIPLRGQTFIFNYCYPYRYSIKEICEAFHDVAGYDLPRTFPNSLIAALLSGLRAINPHDKGVISAARVAKLTVSTNVIPFNLMQLGFQWDTDINTGLKSWYENSNGMFS